MTKPNLQYIADYFDHAADVNEENINTPLPRNPGPVMAEARRSLVAGREFAAALRRPGISDAEVVAALEQACRSTWGK